MLAWHRELIALRTSIQALGSASAPTHAMRAWESERVLVIHRRGADGSEALLILGFAPMPATVKIHEPAGTWYRRLDANDAPFGGPGPGARSPSTLDIAPEGAEVALPGYPAMVFLPGRS